MKLLPGGKGDPYSCVPCLPWEGLYACSVAMPICMHAAVGVDGIYREQGFAFACCKETQHGAPYSRPFPLSHPLQNPPAPSRPHSPCVPAFSSSVSEAFMAEQWPSYPHQTWNVSPCSYLVPLFSQSKLCVLWFPCQGKSESIGRKCVDSESKSATEVFRVEGIGDSVRIHGEEGPEKRIL